MAAAKSAGVLLRAKSERRYKPMKLKERPSKQEEIDFWRAFVAALPDSYLRSMFLGTEGQVESMIKNDFAYDPIPEMRAVSHELREDVKRLTDEKNELVKLLTDLKAQQLQAERAANRAKDELEDIKKAARRLCS